MTKSSLKEISITEMQTAFSKALSDLAGFECSVTLSELRFDTSNTVALFGREVAAMSGVIQKHPNYSEDLGA